jgi:molybdopterin converting factor small subunit
MGDAAVTLVLFAAAREAAGRSRHTIDPVDAPTVGAVLDVASARFGAHFATVLAHCRVWCNGEPATRDTPVRAGDEVAVLPPVSGGA